MSADDPTLPERIWALLVKENVPLTAAEITEKLGNVSRTAVNRALTKVKDRKHVRFLGRTIGWAAETSL